MAILKHLAIKKKDYSDIQQYLIFKCEQAPRSNFQFDRRRSGERPDLESQRDSNLGTHKPLRDDTGHMIQRDNYIQGGMNCNPTAQFSNFQFENCGFAKGETEFGKSEI